MNQVNSDAIGQQQREVDDSILSQPDHQEPAIPQQNARSRMDEDQDPLSAGGSPPSSPQASAASSTVALDASASASMDGMSPSRRPANKTTRTTPKSIRTTSGKNTAKQPATGNSGGGAKAKATTATKSSTKSSTLTGATGKTSAKLKMKRARRLPLGKSLSEASRTGLGATAKATATSGSDNAKRAPSKSKAYRMASSDTQSSGDDETEHTGDGKKQTNKRQRRELSEVELEMKRLSNRLSSRRSQERKRQQLSYLQEKKDELQEANDDLKATNIKLKQAISEMRSSIGKQGHQLAAATNAAVALVNSPSRARLRSQQSPQTLANTPTSGRMLDAPDHESTSTGSALGKRESSVTSPVDGLQGQPAPQSQPQQPQQSHRHAQLPQANAAQQPLQGLSADASQLGLVQEALLLQQLSNARRSASSSVSVSSGGAAGGGGVLGGAVHGISSNSIASLLASQAHAAALTPLQILRAQRLELLQRQQDDHNQQLIGRTLAQADLPMGAQQSQARQQWAQHQRSLLLSRNEAAMMADPTSALQGALADTTSSADSIARLTRARLATPYYQGLPQLHPAQHTAAAMSAALPSTLPPWDGNATMTSALRLLAMQDQERQLAQQALEATSIAHRAHHQSMLQGREDTAGLLGLLARRQTQMHARGLQPPQDPFRMSQDMLVHSAMLNSRLRAAGLPVHQGQASASASAGGDSASTNANTTTTTNQFDPQNDSGRENQT